MYQERIRNNAKEDKMKIDHADLVLQLANALREGNTTKGSDNSKEEVTPY